MLGVNFISISANFYTSFALDENNQLWGCGCNKSGQLGIDSNISNLLNFKKISERVGTLMNTTQENIRNIKSAQ